MLERQPMLIFNFPRKKTATLHSSQPRLSGNKDPSQQSCVMVFGQQAGLKIRKNTQYQPVWKGTLDLSANDSISKL